MNDVLPTIFVFGLAVAFVIGLVWLQGYLAKKREEELRRFRETYGFTLHADEPPGCSNLFGLTPTQSSLSSRVLAMFEGFVPFGNGHSQRVANLMTGEIGSGTMYVFDYHYATGSGKNRQEFHYAVTALRVSLAFRNLKIQPEGFFEKVGAALGFRDIQFELEEFNRQYYVTCGDQKFAYDIVHPAMIEFLLGAPRLNWQFMGPFIVIYKSGSHSVAELESLIAIYNRFCELIPDYVKQDIGFTPRWTTPFD